MENKRSIFSSIFPQESNQGNPVNDKVLEDLKKDIEKISEKINSLTNKIVLIDEENKKIGLELKKIDSFKEFGSQILQKIDSLESQLTIFDEKLKSNAEKDNIPDLKFAEISDNLNLMKNEILLIDEENKKIGLELKKIDSFKEFGSQILQKIDSLESQLTIFDEKLKSNAEKDNIPDLKFAEISDNLNLMKNEILLNGEKIFDIGKKVELIVDKENAAEEKVKSFIEKNNPILKENIPQPLNSKMENIMQKLSDFTALLNENSDRAEKRYTKEESNIIAVLAELNILKESIGNLSGAVKSSDSFFQDNFGKFLEDFKKEIDKKNENLHELFDNKIREFQEKILSEFNENFYKKFYNEIKEFKAKNSNEFEKFLKTEEVSIKQIVEYLGGMNEEIENRMNLFNDSLKKNMANSEKVEMDFLKGSTDCNSKFDEVLRLIRGISKLGESVNDSIRQNLQEIKEYVGKKVGLVASLEGSLFLINDLHKTAVLINESLDKTLLNISEMHLRDIGGASGEILYRLMLETKGYVNYLKLNTDHFAELKDALSKRLKSDIKE